MVRDTERHEAYRSLLTWASINGVTFKVDTTKEGERILTGGLADVSSSVLLDRPETIDSVDALLSFVISNIKTGVENERERIEKEMKDYKDNLIYQQKALDDQIALEIESVG
jgi:hypothetical protein